MITEDTRIDYERIGDILDPSVSVVLSDAFGSDFSRASQDERLLLMEAVAFSLREGGRFCDNLRAVVGCAPDLPHDIYTGAGLGTNEGLKLLAILQVAIVESFQFWLTKDWSSKLKYPCAATTARGGSP